MQPFREGNGRTQEAFISELGRQYGHEIDFTVISKTRMIEASISTTNDTSHPAMKHVIKDMMDPNRGEALRGAFSDLEEVGEKPFEHYIRTARKGEEISGNVFGYDNRVATLATEQGIIAVNRADLPEQLQSDDEEVKFTARSDFTSLGRSEQSQEVESTPRQAEQPQRQSENAELKAIEAEHLASRQQQQSRDDRDR